MEGVMPPKVKITKDEIIDTAVKIVNEQGADMINARNVAKMLGSSTQPVFSNFATMDALRDAVINRANSMYEEYIQKEIDSKRYPDYKASGMAYIRFAREQKQLFRLLFMRERTEGQMHDAMSDSMQSIVHDSTGLSGKSMEFFHLEMWAYVHGIATMLATGYLDLEESLISKMLTDCYMGLKKQYGAE